MDIKSFDQQFPDLAWQDPCQMVLMDVDPEADGIYDLIDFYCLDPDCDCRKVFVSVMDSRQKQVATIAYGWEDAKFYRALGTDREVAQALSSRGFLPPMAPQSEHAQYFLAGFSWMVTDKEFIDRFKDRYRLFKSECARTGESLKWDNVIKFPSNKRA
jgi:hypothetical protein